MLRALLDRNPDIQKLVDDGYHVAAAGGYLLVHDVPYVTSEGVIARATLADELSADVSSVPKSHTIWFTGSDPCNSKGEVLVALCRASPKQLVGDIVAQHQFSQKPTVGPKNYGGHYAKIVAYVRMLEGHAQQIDPTVTAQTHHPIADDDEECPLKYLDTASTRAGIVLATSKLKVEQVAIVGLGGTGCYVLDQLAKLPVRKIHLFDGDTFNQHNAFRAPGAASIDELSERPKKVDYFKSHYEPMHAGIESHPYHVEQANLEELGSMDFVFMAFDGGPIKAELVKYLVAKQIRFLDVGMGLIEKDGQLAGQLRVSSVTASNWEQAFDPNFIPCTSPDEDEYDFNVQVADMNALNAILAIIRFKKLLGFYKDFEDSQSYIYGIFDNSIVSESPT